MSIPDKRQIKTRLNTYFFMGSNDPAITIERFIQYPKSLEHLKLLSTSSYLQYISSSLINQSPATPTLVHLTFGYIAIYYTCTLSISVLIDY